ncbi:MAG: AAA family ATPase [Magnetococcales bacterium]|nr:AAA family ATPase [Magnetococcales bacterium]
MYLNHFGLNELPFKITPDTDFLFLSAGLQEAMNVVLVALSTGEVFVKITGEVGTGKTLLCRQLLATLDQMDFVTCYILNPLMGPQDAYKAFADELGLTLPDESEGFQGFIKRINEHLLMLHGQGKKVVLLIDEAQSLSDATLEAIRLMTNLETKKQKILQVVLVGQTELDVRLNSQHNLRQLQQRISFSSKVPPLSAQETERYIGHRLQVAGGQGREIIAHRACRQIFRYSRGIPRLINVLSHKALLAAFGTGDQQVSPKHVQLAAKDTDGVQVSQRWRPNLSLTNLSLTDLRWTDGLMLLVILLAGLYWWWRMHP